VAQGEGPELKPQYHLKKKAPNLFSEMRLVHVEKIVLCWADEKGIIHFFSRTICSVSQ
jgi:hypothetical protein